MDQKVPVDGNAVQAAIEARSLESLRILLTHWDINRLLKPSTTTALGFAVRDKTMAEWLLDHGASPNVQSAVDFTPLSAAVSVANKQVVEIMLKRGGDLRRGQLFHCVARSGQAESIVMENLFEAGAPIDEIEFENDPQVGLQAGQAATCSLCAG
ncbi:hypothetical protein LTR35_017529 [Friedmanniomyces endolithicus]|nr:hypothetical protein LTS09_018128 [Friedmanniomyces endolithicus]KAK0263577.1 hypothetical protein LTR35_017529 [Friedmanniomyces endolithicus]KAK0267291.1 hypothetical protein LTS00_017828 [Friedmanniomyces endolithicus]